MVLFKFERTVCLSLSGVSNSVWFMICSVTGRTHRHLTFQISTSTQFLKLSSNYNQTLTEEELVVSSRYLAFGQES